MASFPSFETLLLEVHQSLAPHLGLNLKSSQKERFVQLEKTLDGHIHMTITLLVDIFSELGVGPAIAEDAILAVQEMFGFHRALEMETWTYDADARQIAWHLLAASDIPALGRRVAFWDLAGRLDQGMPGGAFWFLPQETVRNGAAGLRLPVANVMAWLVDLMGTGLKDITDDAFKKNFYDWRNGSLPDNKSIGAYFNDVQPLTLNGCFFDTPAAAHNERFAHALRFIASKKLDADQLRGQIPLGADRVIEAVLEGRASQETTQHFIDLLAQRYAMPSLATIRLRLYFARIIQDGYERLVRFLCPGVDKHSADPLQNKVLQLVYLFEFSYNLTIQAEQHGATEAQTNAWFERQLPPWIASELFLAILPSMQHVAAQELGSKLTSRFAECVEGGPLEDVFLPRDMRAIIARDTQRLAASLVSADDTLPATPLTSLEGILAQLHAYLNNDRANRPADSEQCVAQLLASAQANPAVETLSAVMLQYRAKHQLAMNDFDGAAALFSDAFDACKHRGYGPMRGEIARDALALAVAMRPLHRNDERYYRTALLYNQIEGAAPTLQDAAPAMADYFWEDLYRPYPGYANEMAPLKVESEKLLEAPMAMVRSGDWKKFEGWMDQNRRLISKRLRDVRGDTIVSLWLKMLQELERVAALSQKMFMYGPHNNKARSDRMHDNIRTAIAAIVARWPALLNIADFKGQTPLMLAADGGDLVLTQKFLGAEADIGKQDFLGRTALHSAVTARAVPIARLLLDAGIDPAATAGKEGNTALHTAVRMGTPPLVAMLLDHAPELLGCHNHQDKTPGMLAVDILDHLPAHILNMQSAGRKTGSAQDFAAIAAMFA